MVPKCSDSSMIIRNSPMKASEYPDELLNSTSFDIHPMKMVIYVLSKKTILFSFSK